MSVNERAITEKLMEITEKKVSKEQQGVSVGKYMDQLITMKMIKGNYLRKAKTMYTGFLDLVEAFDRVGREALWALLQI